MSRPIRKSYYAGFILLPVVLLLALVAAVAYLGNRETGLASAMARGSTDQDKARYAAEAGLNRAIAKMHDTGCSGAYPIILFSPVKDNGFDGGSYYAYAGKLSGSPVDIYSTGTYGDASITLVRKDTPMHQSTASTVTLQPGSEGIDTYLQNTGSTNYGNAISLLANPGSAVPMLQFDLSAIPTGSHVTSATLSTYASGGSGSDQVTLYRVTRDWTEAANWSTSDGSTSWSQPGGDVVALAVVSTLYTGTGTWLSWDVTGLVDKWVKGSLPNQGVQLRAGSALSALNLSSSDAPTAAQRPKLAVTFLPPCGWTPPDVTVSLNPTVDTDIDWNFPTTNFGSQPDLYVSYGYPARSLLQFDLSGVKAGSKVKSATLRLYLGALTVNASPATKTSVNLTLNVHTVTKTWKELEATWRRRVSGTNWSTQGGDYLSTAVTSKSVPAGTGTGIWVEFTVTPLVQEWVDGVTANNGLIVVLPTNSTEELIFNSREATGNPPELVVTYQ